MQTHRIVKKKSRIHVPKASDIKITDANGNVRIEKADRKKAKKVIEQGIKKKASIKRAARKEIMSHVLNVPVKPTPKGRPRMTRGGRVFTPQTTLDAEAIIAQAWDGPRYEGLVEVECVFTPEGTTVVVKPIDGTPSKLRGDIDNYVKLLMDGLNGVAWLDDKQVTVIKAEKR
jgi:crossover junction endodeoxyribonuclease RusA